MVKLILVDLAEKPLPKVFTFPHENEHEAMVDYMENNGQLGLRDGLIVSEEEYDEVIDRILTDISEGRQYRRDTEEWLWI